MMTNFLQVLCRCCWIGLIAGALAIATSTSRYWSPCLANYQSAISVGPRERVVLLESWTMLVLGVAPDKSDLAHATSLPLQSDTTPAHNLAGPIVLNVTEPYKMNGNALIKR